MPWAVPTAVFVDRLDLVISEFFPNLRNSVIQRFCDSETPPLTPTLRPGPAPQHRPRPSALATPTLRPPQQRLASHAPVARGRSPPVTRQGAESSRAPASLRRLPALRSALGCSGLRERREGDAGGRGRLRAGSARVPRSGAGAAAMGLGSSSEGPGGGAEGFHVHGVRRPRGDGGRKVGRAARGGGRWGGSGGVAPRHLARGGRAAPAPSCWLLPGAATPAGAGRPRRSRYLRGLVPAAAASSGPRPGGTRLPSSLWEPVGLLSGNLE